MENSKQEVLCIDVHNNSFFHRNAEVFGSSNIAYLNKKGMFVKDGVTVFSSTGGLSYAEILTGIVVGKDLNVEVFYLMRISRMSRFLRFLYRVFSKKNKGLEDFIKGNKMLVVNKQLHGHTLESRYDLFIDPYQMQSDIVVNKRAFSINALSTIRFNMLPMSKIRIMIFYNEK